MKLSSVQKGPFTLYTIETGRFKLDGGAMFGVIPKPMWEKKIPADDQNRIDMAMRSLLVKSEKTGRLYLIDNGSGDKFNEKMSAIYDFSYPYGTLQDSLAAHGFSPDDVTDIIFTHLHFDHCGGTTRFNKAGELELVFKNANYWVGAKHWATANSPNVRERASFFAQNLEPMRLSKRMKFTREGDEFEPGFSMTFVNGHSEGQQLPVIRTEGFSLVFAADLIPTAAHVSLPWVMGYDMRPADTLTEKEQLLKQWHDEGCYLFLEHDATHEVITLVQGKRYIESGESITLSDL
ncbi:Metallo-beta-lactamase superfamily protein [Cyclonatronum proteinivorum]|uniref:Metallo-beta-lactamase superfamily protein n=1 Tax=Cyclonatronum proteinivorum TaxID=1457365 RepID=A0A345UJ57_9BACT|nr:MBL fold metallo-hydrolase [Cyclonatronum proteinivorum]AXJ00509.1 Metallo-beta-lactamase superfamily protein [Cyclonatronum proteinivorum]